jgi:hypothetical protein
MTAAGSLRIGYHAWKTRRIYLRGLLAMISKVRLAEYLALIGIAVFALLAYLNWHSYRDDAPPGLSFDGNSENLRQTVIVPTLDTPIPDGKSAIWCASFQMAWNKLSDDVGKGPIKIQGAEAIADRLNRAEQSEDDLDKESTYSAAGFIKKGIIEKIQTDMAEKFPEVPKPEFRKNELDVAVAYAYLKAEVRFKHAFFDNPEPAAFMPGENPTEVRFFGVAAKEAAEELRNQVELLFLKHGEHYSYAIDLCKSSTPNQLVLASLPKKSTLSQILSDLEKKSTDYLSQDHQVRFEHSDLLLVPNMHWRIVQHFKEIEGMDKPLLNPSMEETWIDQAIQVIEFELDRKGARVASESRAITHKGGNLFVFNRPFST